MLIENIVLGLSSVAAILAITDFFKSFIKYKAVIFILAVLLCGSLACQLQQIKDEIVSDVATMEMKKSAQVVADSILISGWEETGDYLGYMAQITGFYRRYESIYSVEAELYFKELSGWRDYFEEKRKTGQSFSTYDIDGLIGLVKSAEEHLVSIAKEQGS